MSSSTTSSSKSSILATHTHRYSLSERADLANIHMNRQGDLFEQILNNNNSKETDSSDSDEEDEEAEFLAANGEKKEDNDKENTTNSTKSSPSSSFNTTSIIRSNEICLFDIETTIPPEMIEFGSIIVNKSGFFELGSYSTLIKPQREQLDKRSTSIHGITSGMLVNSPLFVDVCDKIFDQLDGRIWMGHNIISFDIIHLNRSFHSVGKRPPTPSSIIDTLPLIRKLYGPRAGDHKMASLSTYFGLGEEKHRAVADCRLTLEVFKNICLTLILEQNLPKVFIPPNSNNNSNNGNNDCNKVVVVATSTTNSTSSSSTSTPTPAVTLTPSITNSVPLTSSDNKLSDEKEIPKETTIEKEISKLVDKKVVEKIEATISSPPATSPPSSNFTNSPPLSISTIKPTIATLSFSSITTDNKTANNPIPSPSPTPSLSPSPPSTSSTNATSANSNCNSNVVNPSKSWSSLLNPSAKPFTPTSSPSPSPSPSPTDDSNEFSLEGKEKKKKKTKKNKEKEKEKEGEEKEVSPLSPSSSDGWITQISKKSKNPLPTNTYQVKPFYNKEHSNYPLASQSLIDLLDLSMEEGNWMWMIYQGGSSPGTGREILPIKWENKPHKFIAKIPNFIDRPNNNNNELHYLTHKIALLKHLNGPPTATSTNSSPLTSSQIKDSKKYVPPVIQTNSNNSNISNNNSSSPVTSPKYFTSLTSSTSSTIAPSKIVTSTTSFAAALLAKK